MSISARASTPCRARVRPWRGELSVRLGGKGANQAVAAARAGATVAMRGAVGTESFGLDPVAALEGYGVDMTGVATLAGASGAALITVDAQGENTIVVSPGANGRMAAAGPSCAGALLLAQLELPPELVRDAFRAHKAAGARTVLNAAPAVDPPEDLFALTDILIVNETELARYAGAEPADPADEDEIERAARGLRRPGQTLIVTLGARGALALAEAGRLRVPARPAEARDTTGAGDCFCGALAARLAEGAPLDVALEFAAAAAAISVTRDGAASGMPDRAEIDGALAG